jgi:sugar phosphate isomerase/epimerase
MKVGIHSGVLSDYRLSEIIPRLADLGYQGLELNAETGPWGEPHVTPDLGLRKRAAIRQLVQDHGLEISSISAHISLIDADDAARQQHVDFVKGCIDLATDVGTNIVHAISGLPSTGVARERAWKWLVESISACIDHAVERGVVFGIEADEIMLVASMADLGQLMADLETAKLHVNFDASHSIPMGEDPAEWVKTLNSRIVHVHLKDVRPREPSKKQASLFGIPVEFEYPPLGKGIIDWKELFGALRQINYSGFLSVEYAAHHFGYREDPWEVASEAKRFIDNVL